MTKRMITAKEFIRSKHAQHDQSTHGHRGNGMQKPVRPPANATIREKLAYATAKRKWEESQARGGMSEELVDAMTNYVTDPDQTSKSDFAVLAENARKSKTNARELYRIQARDLQHSIGDAVEFSPISSFTRKDITGGESAGQIGWKDSDEALYKIKSPRRGLDINYNAINTLFNSAAEQETLITGKYRVVEKRMVLPPGYPEGYEKIPLYILDELP